MLENNQNISEKSKWNAISAYLMIFISWLFLFNKQNPEINNPFVRAHTKTAMLIHFWFLLTYIVFISNWVLAWYSILWFWINNIITNIIYIFLLVLLIIWIYNASHWKSYNISKNLNISKNKNILDIDWNWKITEKEKITIILSYIPFIWYYIFWKYSKNQTILNATKINLIVSLIITLLFIFWYTNLATLFSLAYIVFITFIWITLFSINELITINLPEIFSPSKIYLLSIVLLKYLKNYFNSNNFKTFDTIKNEIILKQNQEFEKDEKELKTKKDIKLPKELIYIPFLNLIFLFFKNTKYSFHIINWLIITLLLTISFILNKTWYMNINLNILFLFPILFWLWNLKYKLAYKIPIIFDIYILFKNLVSIFKTSKKVIKEKKAEEKEISLKPKEV